MATVTHIGIFYRRQIQPAQYESAEARIEGQASVDEGENWELVAYEMLVRARAQAHRALDRPVPEAQPFNAAGEEARVDISAFRSSPDAEPAKVDGSPAAQEKRKRRTKAEMEAARQDAEIAEQIAKTEAQAAKADDIILPGEDPTPAAAADTTAAVAATEDDLDFLNIEPEEPVKEISYKDLQIHAAAASRALGVDGAQIVIGLLKAEFSTGRLGELPEKDRYPFLKKVAEKLPQEKRQAFLDAIDK